MATTTTYGLNKPTVGGDENTWGGLTNDNWDDVDDLLDGTAPIKPNLDAGLWRVGGVAVTATAAELNILDGVTASTAEINILDGVTSTTAELNILDGVTASAAEINLLDGKAIATPAEYRAATADKILTADQVWSSGAVVALSDGATISVDLASGFNFSVTLGGNRTLANPANPKVGQSGFIRVTQDGTGSRTLTLSSNYLTQGGAALTLSSAAGAVDILYYTVLSSTEILINGAYGVS